MFILVGIIAIIAVSGSNGQELCTTPWSTKGSCINVAECGPFLIMLRKTEPLKAEERNALSSSQCGVVGDVPKVCCPHDGQIRPVAVTPVTPTLPDAPPDVSNHPNLRLLPNDQCGVATEVRIYGGTVTKVLEFPWMALIGYRVGRAPNVTYQCGGSVISKRYILTAAHCVIGLNYGVRLASVRVGEHDTSKERDCDYEKKIEIICGDKYQEFNIERAHYLNQYSSPSQGKDIALIRVAADIDFTKNNVKPICLPFGNATTLKSSKAIVTGWGLNETIQYSEALVKVRLPIVPLAECASVYKKTKGRIDVLGNQLCAGGEAGKDSCAGDSGGPLQSPDDSNGSPQFVQYGVVSYGPSPCGTAGLPGVYTNVAYYMDWILDTIQD